MIYTIVHSTTGVIHLISAVLALILGSMVLLARKGTRIHRLNGYGFTVSMLVLNGTAFGLYHLFGKLGPFHFAALVSLFTLVIGMIPAITRKPEQEWLKRHTIGMYYAVIGLYAAFASEIVVRIPGVPFFSLVILATLLVMVLGIYVYQKQYKTWIRSSITNNKPYGKR
jgi:uncharacterized membrane protein